MSVQSNKTLDIVIDALLVVAIVLGIILTYLFLSMNLAYGLAMLVGIWYIDAYLKKSFEYPNETLFADLSFAAFMFFVGQKGLEILSKNQGATSSTLTAETQVMPIIIGLCITWLGNLRLCRGLVHPDRYLKTPSQLPYIWTISFLFACISIFAALLPQILELY